jgi:hypothetical protein
MSDDTFNSGTYSGATTRRASYLPYWFRLRIHIFVAHYIAPIARHPAMTLITGIGLLLSGMLEAFEQIFTDFESLVGPREGVILLGIVTFFKGIADMVEASEWLSRGVEEERQKQETTHH